MSQNLIISKLHIQYYLLTGMQACYYSHYYWYCAAVLKNKCSWTFSLVKISSKSADFNNHTHTQKKNPTQWTMYTCTITSTCSLLLSTPYYRWNWQAAHKWTEVKPGRICSLHWGQGPHWHTDWYRNKSFTWKRPLGIKFYGKSILKVF